MKWKVAAIMMLGILLLVACNSDNNDQLANGNKTENMRALVEQYSAGDIKNESASITSNQLIVTKGDQKEVVYDLSGEEFFVSVAPYINETHPCTNHSLTGCQGEMVNEEFDVYIEDEDGHVIMDETITSPANGFIDLWLPRDKTYRVKIEHDGKRAESDITTFDGDGTCITTMKLV